VQHKEHKVELKVFSMTDCEISFSLPYKGRQPKYKPFEIRVTEANFVKRKIRKIDSRFRQHTKYIFEQAKKMIKEIQPKSQIVLRKFIGNKHLKAGNFHNYTFV